MGSTANSRQTAPPLRRRLLSFPTLLSFALAAALIYFLATRFDLDWGETWDNVRGLDLRLYAVAFAAYYLSFSLRGLRWRMLAHNAGLDSGPDSRLPSVPRFAQLIVMGWFINSIVPLHAGDPYRAYALSQDSNSDFPSSLGTVLAERVTDMVTVLVLILVGVAWFSTTRDPRGTWPITAAAFLMALGLATLLVVMKVYGVRLARFLPGRFEGPYRRFHRGALGSLRRLPIIFLLGLAAWMLEASRLYLIVQALDLSIGLPLVLVAALGHAVLSTVGLPGGIGVVEPGVTGLLVLSLDLPEAVSVILVDRTITYLSVIAIGGIAFLLWQASHARKRRLRPLAASPPEHAGDSPD